MFAWLMACMLFETNGNGGPSLLYAQAPPLQRKVALVAMKPAFWRLIRRDASLRVLSSTFGFTEGPVWDKAGFVWVSDEIENKIYRLYEDGRREEVIALGDPDGSTSTAPTILWLDLTKQSTLPTRRWTYQRGRRRKFRIRKATAWSEMVLYNL